VRRRARDDSLGLQHHQVGIVDRHHRREQEGFGVFEVFVEDVGDVLRGKPHRKSIAASPRVQGSGCKVQGSRSSSGFSLALEQNYISDSEHLEMFGLADGAIGAAIKFIACLEAAGPDWKKDFLRRRREAYRAKRGREGRTLPGTSDPGAAKGAEPATLDRRESEPEQEPEREP